MVHKNTTNKSKNANQIGSPHLKYRKLVKFVCLFSQIFLDILNHLPEKSVKPRRNDFVLEAATSAASGKKWRPRLTTTKSAVGGATEGEVS